MEDELLEQLERDFPDVVVERSMFPYARILEARFPFVGSGIDWERVPRGRVRDCLDPERWVEEGVLFAVEVLAVERLDRGPPIVAIGDGPIDVALRIPRATLAACLPNLLHMPQHTFVMAPDGAWCLAFVMSGYFAFGYAAD